MESQEQTRKRILWYSDSPTCATGFAQVARNLLKIYHDTEKYDIYCVGINYYGDPFDHNEYPYMIYPAMAAGATDPEMRNDPYGRKRLLSMLKTGYFDALFIIQDTFVMQSVIKQILEIRKNLPQDKKFSIIHYFPIDGVPKKDWIMEEVSNVDIPVCYTQFGKEECLKYNPNLKNMKVIWHGVNKNTFFPMKDDPFREQYFKMHKDDFIVLNVNRNQPRKDLARTFRAFKEFKYTYNHPDSFLFILAQAHDVGGDLFEIAEDIGLEYDKDWACPSPTQYNANQGYPIDVVNKIYNASDLIFSTTLGEGFGLSIIEAMAVKKPVLFPRNTALVEIVGENEKYGWLYNSGSNENLWQVFGPHDNDVARPLADVYDAAKVMGEIYTLWKNNPEKIKEKTDAAYNDLKTWKDWEKDWLEVMDRGMNLTDALRKQYVKPNEPCPCGCGLKWKQCHGRMDT